MSPSPPPPPQVPTAGLLNIVGAPHLAHDSTYRATYTPRAVKSYRTGSSDAVVEAAIAGQQALGYIPKVGRAMPALAGAAGGG
jgi:hypothetical protein